MSPTDGPSRPPRLRFTRVASVLLIVALVLGTAACDGERADPDATRGLLVLSGEVGAISLAAWDDPSGEPRDIVLPDDASVWVAAGRANVLLVTLVDGRTFVSAPLVDGVDLAWRAVEADRLPVDAAELPRYFGTWDPAGGVFAVLGADFAGDDAPGAKLQVEVVDPTLIGASVIDVPGLAPRPAPPAWVDGDRVAVVAGPPDAPAIIIVDTPTGDLTAGPTGTRLVVSSADASTVATWSGGDAPVEVRPTDAWLAGDAAIIRIDRPSGAGAPISLALDRPGRRLAIAWAGDDGRPERVAIHAADADWSEVAEIELGPVEVASVAWLR